MYLNLGAALNSLKQKSDTFAVNLMHAVKLIRTEIFSSFYKFNGSFGSKIQVSFVPKTLLSLINMLLEGPANFDPIDNQAALSIAQLIVFNAIKRPRKTSTDHVRIHVS